MKHCKLTCFSNLQIGGMLLEQTRPIRWAMRFDSKQLRWICPRWMFPEEYFPSYISGLGLVKYLGHTGHEIGIESHFTFNWFFYKKWAHPGLFDILFLVFSNKHHYKFYNKYIRKNIHLVYGAVIRTYDL